MELVNEVYEIFWSESFWLPPNVTWSDFDAKKDIHTARPRELLFAFPLAIVLFILRLIWERVVALPLGRYFQIKETPPKRAEHNDDLEAAFKKNRRQIPDHATIIGLAKQADMSPRQVERWWRKRRVQDKPSEMQRWKETTWRFTFYIGAFYYGVYVLWDKPWTWDTKHCWYGYPWQHVSDDIWWYYMVELGFYWSLVLSLFMDNKRKDFVEMIIHHVATITLMVFSWANNMVRIGTIVLVVHDAVDYWMEGAKLAKYAKFHKLCDILFVIFTVVWFITRIVLFPYRVLHASLIEGRDELVGRDAETITPLYYVYNGALLTLQVLHIIWFTYILRALAKFLKNGQVEKDERSESEMSNSEEEEQRNSKGEGDIAGVTSNNNVKVTENGSVHSNSAAALAPRTSKIPTRRNVQRDH